MMNRAGRLLLLFASFAVFAANLSGQVLERTEMPLWPSGMSGSTGVGDGDVPKLIVTLVESESPTAAVVIFPGGGYWGHAIDHEGYQFADWFASLGVSSAVCTYRLRGKGNDGKGYGHPIPMRDGQRAIQTLRARAAEWHLDPKRIGAIGFSAGGHLCATISTHFADISDNQTDSISRVSSRPDFAILAYPVIAFGRDFTHQGSQRNLIGEAADQELIELLSNDRQVSKETPPTFLFHTVADKAVPVENSIEYFKACRANDVAVEMHLFPNGRHGLGLAKNTPGTSHWPKLCASWLSTLGVVTVEVE